MPAQPVFRGYSITGLARPGQFDNESAFPGINLNQNVELGLKNTFDNMIDHFEKAESEAAEALARQMLSRGGLPVLYRVYSHVVSIFFSAPVALLSTLDAHSSLPIHFRSFCHLSYVSFSWNLPDSS